MEKIERERLELVASNVREKQLEIQEEKER